MTETDDGATAKEQLEILIPEVVRAYASGEIAWSQLRHRYGVRDFGLLIQRVGEEGLHLPGASPDRPTHARNWLRAALTSEGAA